MAAGDMPGFMSQHAANLVWTICFNKRAAMHEQIITITDKSI